MMLNRTRDFFRYLPAGPRERLWGLSVTAAGLQATPPGAGYPPKGHPATHAFIWHRGRVLDQYGVLYLVHGKGEFDSKPTGPRKLAAGDVFLVFPGVWHRYRPLPDVGWEVYWAHFQGEHADRLQQCGFISPEEPVLNVGLSDTVLHPFIRLLDRLRAEPMGFQQLIAADTLEIIAAALSESQSKGTDSRIHDQVRQAKALLEADVDVAPLMDNIVAELGLSRAQFFRVFKKYTGLSPHQYRLESKLNRARQMLCDSNLSVKQIAQALGFRNVYHFSKLFKNKMGTAPTQWRHPRLPELLGEQTHKNRRKCPPSPGRRSGGRRAKPKKPRTSYAN